jgi:PAS domain S-box-containing protein
MSPDDSKGPPGFSQQDAEAFRLLVSTVRDYAIFLLGTDGCVVSWNAGAVALYGYSADEITGEHFSRFYQDEAQQQQWPQHELKIAAEAGRFEDEGWRVRKDRSRFWANVVITALRDPGGKLLWFAKVTRDLTERRQYEQQLEQREEHLRSLIDGVRHYAIFTLDLEGVVTSWNAGAREIKGYEPDEVIGTNFSRFYTPDAVNRGWPQKVLQAAKEQGHCEDEGWRVCRDGSRFWANVVITALRNQSGDVVGYSKITRDLTERRRREEALTQSEERLRKQGEALENTLRRTREFIAMLSHELRNSLAPIRNAASLMARKRLDPPLERLRQMIDRQSAALSRIVEDLMDVSRVEQGIFSIECEPVLLTDVLTRAVEASRPLIEARRHAMQMPLPNEPIELLGDSVRLSQAFINLLNNAARYTAIGGRIDIFAEITGQTVTVRVADTGRGIEPELLDRVFEPFTQLAPNDKEARSGIGVGLSLVRRIVELHGGTVKAQSEGIGHGSEFIVTLPLVKAQTHPELESPKKVPRAVSPIRVLCVEAGGNELAGLVNAMGHTAAVAYDGAAALQVALTFRPHMALLDIDMPAVNGYELAARLHHEQRDPPPMLVALTGWGHDRDKQRAQDAGFQRYIAKPLTSEVLEGLLAACAPDVSDGRAV